MKLCGECFDLQIKLIINVNLGIKIRQIGFIFLSVRSGRLYLPTPTPQHSGALQGAHAGTLSGENYKETHPKYSHQEDKHTWLQFLPQVLIQPNVESG